MNWMKNVMCCIVFVLIVCTMPKHALAEDLFFSWGLMGANSEHSYSWQLDYRQELGRHGGFGVGYLNEGHVKNHHRDGHLMQLWVWDDFLNERLNLAAGAGAFYYYDTTASKMKAANGANGYMNDHGLGAALSTSATWSFENRWLLQLRSNINIAPSSIDTYSALLGVGYQLEEPAHRKKVPVTESDDLQLAKNSATLFVGKTIINSFDSEKSASVALEYRRHVMKFLDVSGLWLFEGDSRLSRRHGLAGQVWAVRNFLDNRFGLGIGIGPYFSVSRYHDTSNNFYNRNIVSGLATMTTKYDIAKDWNVRASWNRVITGNDRDGDVIMFGVGYNF